MEPRTENLFGLVSMWPVVVRLPCGVRSGACKRPLTAFSTKGGTEMMRRLLVCSVLVLALKLAAYGDDKTGTQPPRPTNSGLETMKKLAGTWLAADNDGQPTDQMVSIIKVTAGRRAGSRTLFSPPPPAT